MAGARRQYAIRGLSDDKIILPTDKRGAIAQLGERIVRNDEVVGSIPTSSTKITRTAVPQSRDSIPGATAVPRCLLRSR